MAPPPLPQSFFARDVLEVAPALLVRAPPEPGCERCAVEGEETGRVPHTFPVWPFTRNLYGFSAYRYVATNIGSRTCFHVTSWCCVHTRSDDCVSPGTSCAQAERSMALIRSRATAHPSGRSTTYSSASQPARYSAR